MEESLSPRLMRRLAKSGQLAASPLAVHDRFAAEDGRRHADVIAEGVGKRSLIIEAQTVRDIRNGPVAMIAQGNT